jgi:hypothetical protein
MVNPSGLDGDYGKGQSLGDWQSGVSVVGFGLALASQGLCAVFSLPMGHLHGDIQIELVAPE